MKKSVSVLLALCLCISMIGMLFSCGAPKVVGQGQTPEVYEIEYAIQTPSRSLCHVTYGVDSEGNILHKVVSTSENPELTFHHLHVRGEGKYECYSIDASTATYALLNEYPSEGVPSSVEGAENSSAYGYFAKGWANKNDPAFKDFVYSEIDISEVTEDAAAKGLLESMNCKYYRFSKDGSDVYAILAVHPELDLVLFYGTNYHWDTFTVEFMVTKLEFNQSGSYADLLPK